MYLKLVIYQHNDRRSITPVGYIREYFASQLRERWGAIPMNGGSGVVDERDGLVMTLEDATQARDWNYKGEGAANVVLDYHGSNSILLGKVLRIRKARSSVENSFQDTPVLSDLERDLWKHWPRVASATNEEELRHAYVQEAMLPLLGRNYVDPGMVVPASREFLVALAQNIRDSRPAWRVKAGDLDCTSQNVLLVSDHTTFSDVPGVLADALPTVAIEIKPKWGYLPKSHTIAASNLIKKQVSRFTMHQHLKYAQGKLRNISSYCPLDLFSGTWDRIHKALKALFKTPQNNLRVFIDGAKVFTGSIDGGNDSTDDNDSCDALEESLKGFVDASKGQRLPVLENLITKLLYTTDALKRLLDAQQDDCFDIEGIIHVFYNYLQTDCLECADQKIPESYKDESLKEVEVQRQTAISWLHAMPLSEQKQLLCKFLTAATAKDCSLMLTLKPATSSSDGQNIISCPSTKRKYLYKISFLDLDVKGLDKLPYYFRLDQSIVRFYAQQQSGLTESAVKDFQG